MQRLPAVRTAGDLGVNITSLVRHLRGENASPRTIKGYHGAAGPNSPDTSLRRGCRSTLRT